MNYQSEIERIKAALKADKAIIQPWRNKAMSQLENAQAFIRSGNELTYRQQDGRVDGNAPVAAAGQCICKPGMIARACPVHGDAVS